MRIVERLLGILCVVATVPAHAAYVTITYDGVVSRILNAADAPGIKLGDIVTYSATFDPSTAIDVGSTFVNIDGITGLPVSVPNLRTVSLATDPLASDRITIGDYVFTQADDPDFGRTFGLGAGVFPFGVYNGSELLGIDVGAIAANGLYFFSDPIAELLHFAPSTGVGGLETSDDLGFLVTTALDGVIARAALPVPEPATWSLLVFGIGGLMFAVRRSAIPSAPHRSFVAA